jgi:hypothetical protein
VRLQYKLMYRPLESFGQREGYLCDIANYGTILKKN